MKLGIMQPYFFPYIGYWQLMNIVDKFVIYDDVNYIKKGWINRNRILVDGKAAYFNVPIKKVSQNKKINELQILQDDSVKTKTLKKIELSYKRAPYFDSVFPLVKDIIGSSQSDLAKYLEYSLKSISGYLNIKTDFLISSQIDKDNNLKGQSKILEICKILGATEYYNPIGGRTLYSNDEFLNNGIKLYFVNSNEIHYMQFSNEFISNLSVLDVMMFNSVETIHEMLNEYSLVDK